MEPEDIERKIQEIIKYYRDEQPILKIIKNNGESKFGVYIQIENLEGSGKALFVRAFKISVYPLIEIRDVEYISKGMACEAMNRGLIFE